MTNDRKANSFRKTGLKKTLFILLGIGIPLISFLGSGFYMLDEMQAAVVVEYSPADLFPNNTTLWPYFIALKDEQLPGGTMNIVGIGSKNTPIFSMLGKDIYWHHPTPFGKHQIIDIQQTFQVEIPLVIPDYVYERDEEGNIIGYLRDDLGGRVTRGYYFVLKDGIKFYSPETYSSQRYDPDFNLNVLKVVVTGEYKVTNVETYAMLVKASQESKISWMNETGYYGELISPPLVKDQIEDFFLSEALNIYILDIKLPFVFNAFSEQYPGQSDDFIMKTSIEFLIENPETLMEQINLDEGVIPDFEGFFTSTEFIEEFGVDFEQLYGIDVYEAMEVILFEESL